MAGKKKEINKNNVFVSRFIEQHNKKYRTLEELAKEFSVSRQTVASWMDGKSLPNVDAVVKIARFYNVSADYLLGLSDTVSADVNVRVAVEYTGLSEDAVESLHNGLDSVGYLGMKMADEEKKKTLRAASALIADEAFGRIATSLKNAEEKACLEGIVLKFHVQYPKEENPDLEKAKKIERNIMAERLIQRLRSEDSFSTKSSLDEAKVWIEGSLEHDSLRMIKAIREASDHYQFLASKALNVYLDEVTRNSHHKAAQLVSDLGKDCQKK